MSEPTLCRGSHLLGGGVKPSLAAVWLQPSSSAGQTVLQRGRALLIAATKGVSLAGRGAAEAADVPVTLLRPGGGMLRDENAGIRLCKAAVMAPADGKSLPEMKENLLACSPLALFTVSSFPAQATQNRRLLLPVHGDRCLPAHRRCRRFRHTCHESVC